MKHLKLKDKVLLFSELERLEQSGIPRIQSLQLIGEHATELAKRASETQRLCQLNVSFPSAASKAGLIDNFEMPFISLAEQTGKYESIYQYFHILYQNRLTNQSKLKAQLFLPATIFVLALFISPIPALFQQTISLSDYFFGIVKILISLSAFIYCLLKLPVWVRNNYFGKFMQHIFDNVLLQIPIFSSIYSKGLFLNYFRSLSVTLEAGLPITKALKLSEQCISNSILRKQFSQLPKLIDSGQNLTQAIQSVFSRHVFFDSALKQAIITGEHAGDLSGNIYKMVTFLNEMHQQTLLVVYQWLPRIIYTGIIIYFGLGIVM